MKTKLHLLAFTVFLAAGAVANAQLSSNVSLFATGLNNPRGLAFGPDGFLYVAEGGLGGNAKTVGLCEQVPGPYRPV